MEIKNRILSHLFPVSFLALLIFIVIFSNFSIGTFVTGVDNFHIELDLGLAWERAINGVWQDNQGLGLLTGLAQASEIPRIIWYWLVGLVVPITYLRQVYLFWSLSLGVVGTYFLGNYLFKNKWSAMVAGVFYMTNLASIQIFFIPTEMFVTQFGFLPWKMLIFFKFLDLGNKRWLLLWFIFQILSLPQAMTPTIWMVEMLFFGIGSAVFLWQKRNWNRLILLWVLVFVVNVFWLIPFGYFTVSKSQYLMNAKINQVFSTENYLTNQSRSNLWDVLSLKGMWFDYPDFDGTNMVALMRVWDHHLRHFGFLVF